MSLSAQVYNWNLKTRQGEVFGPDTGFTLPNGSTWGEMGNGTETYAKAETFTV